MSFAKTRSGGIGAREDTDQLKKSELEAEVSAQMDGRTRRSRRTLPPVTWRGTLHAGIKGGRRSGRLTPFVSVRQATDPRERDDRPATARLLRDGARHRCVLLKAQVRPVLVIIREEVVEQPAKVFLVENDDGVQHLSAYGQLWFLKIHGGSIYVASRT